MIDLATTDPTAIAQTAGGAVAVIVGSIFTLQKLMKGWKETSTESNVIEIVNKQMTLMSQSNEMLTKEVNKLQVEIITLNKELRQLSDENQRLHIEVSSLTAEVNRLQHLLKKEE